MRTLRYLGVLAKTGLRGEEADKFLETVKSMPEQLGEQEMNYLLGYGISLSNLGEHSKYEILDVLRKLGLYVFISEKLLPIKDERQKENKTRELLFRLGKLKVIFNLDVERVKGIVNTFTRFRLYNEAAGFGKYCKTIEDDGLRIESKFTCGEEYFVITEL